MSPQLEREKSARERLKEEYKAHLPPFMIPKPVEVSYSEEDGSWVQNGVKLSEKERARVLFLQRYNAAFEGICAKPEVVAHAVKFVVLKRKTSQLPKKETGI